VVRAVESGRCVRGGEEAVDGLLCGGLEAVGWGIE
jgi:hypothetical protein